MASLAVMVVWIEVAEASLALTSDWISALQSMLDEFVVPVVVIVLDEPDVEAVDAEDVALLTVMLLIPPCEETGRPTAGPL